MELAADIVTNHLVEGMGLTLPNGAIRDKSLESLSVEEVYARITDPSKAQRRKLGSREGHKNRDLLVRAAGGAKAVPQVSDDPYAGRWRDAVRKALVVQRMHDQRTGEDSLAPASGWISSLRWIGGCYAVCGEGPLHSPAGTAAVHRDLCGRAYGERLTVAVWIRRVR